MNPTLGKLHFSAFGLVSLLLLLTAMASLFAPGSAQAQAPMLSGVTAHFHTNNDDKDDDTKLSIYVYGPGGRPLVAKSENNTGKYNNGSDHDIGLSILGNHSSSVLAHGMTKVVITPNGHDHWEFTYSLDLTWSDGQVTPLNCGSTALSQDDRTFTCTW